MPTHRETRVLPYTPEQIFDLVADVERYPEFLPWCVGARVSKREDALIVADLMIGFKMIRERYTSKVKLDRPNRIDVNYGHDGPFRHLENHWQFKPADGGGCEVDFFLDIFNVIDEQQLIRVQDLEGGGQGFDYLEGIDFVQPRRYFLGARLRF